MPRTRKLHASICGGGHLGHALAAVLGANDDITVSVATSRAAEWSPEISATYGDLVVIGRISRVTESISTAVEDADLVLLACPAFLHRSVLREISATVRRGAWIGAMPAPGFFHWAAREYSAVTRYFVGTRSPFNCRIKAWGRSVEVSGVLPSLSVAASPEQEGAECRALLRDLLGLPVQDAESFFAATLDPSVTILHPARLYSFFNGVMCGEVSKTQMNFYEGWDDAASESYLRCDAELQSIAASLPCRVRSPSVQDHYGTATPRGLTARIRSLRGLPETPLPILANRAGLAADGGHRFFREDFDIGLSSAALLGRLARANQPTIETLLDWYGRAVPTHTERGSYVKWATKQTAVLPENGLTTVN